MSAAASPWFMRLLAMLPLRVLRGLGWALGHALYALVASRRRVVLRNFELCFPQLPLEERRQLARQHLVMFTQAWLDRSWLWHSPRALLEQRLRLTGAVHELDGAQPTIVFTPHFVGLDAAGLALTMTANRTFVSIYTALRNQQLNDWVAHGRTRFGQVRMMQRQEGIKPVLATLRSGGVLYLLPDVNWNADDRIFVPFFGVPAATVGSLSRLAKLGRAKVVPLVARMTPWGYEGEVLPAWQDFPSGNVVADTARMNQELEGYVRSMPAQYYWVHRRFKTRPDGEPPLY